MARTTRATRAWLAGELAQWRAEGLVDERAARELTRRYDLTGGGTSAALFVVYLVGSVLIGGGVLSFVAWNWDRLPAAAKLGLGAGALVAAYALGHGFGLDGRRPLLGRALLLLGSLLFGANIGIVGQVFHLGGDFAGAAGLWGAGAALAAWLLRSPESGLLAAATGWVWSAQAVEREGGAWTPLLLGAVLVPLAFHLRSPLLFGAAALATGGTLAAASVAGADDELIAASLLATASLLAALDLAFPGAKAAFAAVARRLGIAASVALAYALSFHDVAGEVRFGWDAEVWLAAVLPQLLGLAACVGLAAARGFPRRRALVVLVLGANAALFCAAFLPDPEVPLAVLANLTLAAVAAEGIRASITELARGTFWASVAVVLLVIVSRFLEFETGLLAKAVVFTLAGAAVLAFGISFERRVRARRDPRA